MRTPLVIGNWKMHATLAQARALAAGVRDGRPRASSVETVVCPPFTALAAVGEILAGTPVGLGAQNCHYAASGAHTGEISAPMLLDLGARTILLGHSERRHELGESDELISRKMRAVLEHGGTPVLCVGETEEERRQGLTFTTIEGQLRAGLTGLGAEQIARIVLAYEPVWAIGTGLTATPAQAGEVHGYLRGLLSELTSADIAQGIRILYGGSVKPENTDALMAEPEIDGALVGGASLDVSSFLAIVENSARAGGALKGD
jgi:triosephosphate isomerase